MSKGTPTTPHFARLEGIAWILAASLFFSLMGALSKIVVPQVGVAVVLFWRSLIAAVISLGALRAQRQALRPGRPWLLLLRSVLGLTAMGSFFWALGQIPLGTATTLLYTAPLLTVLLSGVLLGEEPRRGALVLTLVAFVGVALIVRPAVIAMEWGTLMALIAGLAAALARMAVRGMRATDSPSRIVFGFSTFSTLATAPLALGVLDLGLTASPSTASAWWPWLLGVGLAATAGQLTMTRAYSIEQANIVGPFSYATVLISYALGLFIWDESMTWESGIGMTLVVGAGVMLSGAARAEAPSSSDAPQTTRTEDPDGLQTPL